MNEKLYKNAKVEKFTNILGIRSCPPNRYILAEERNSVYLKIAL